MLWYLLFCVCVQIGLEIKVFNSINIFSIGKPYNLLCSTTDIVLVLLKLFYQNSLRNLWSIILIIILSKNILKLKWEWVVLPWLHFFSPSINWILIHYFKLYLEEFKLRNCRTLKSRKSHDNFWKSLPFAICENIAPTKILLLCISKMRVSDYGTKNVLN